MEKTQEDFENEIAYLKDVIAGLTGNGVKMEGLTLPESIVAQALIRANGRILTKGAIHDAVYYDSKDPAGSNVIAVMICRIRKKRPDLDIRNDWGVGYRMVPPEDSAGRSEQPTKGESTHVDQYHDYR